MPSQIPFHSYLQHQLMTAFDIYLEIRRQVDKKLNEHLGYNTPRARLIQQCPPCFFKLQGEPDLEFSVMVTMDGNNSLKRIGPSIRAHDDLCDSHSIDSDRWVSAEDVDCFKDEIGEVSKCSFFLSEFETYPLIRGPKWAQKTTPMMSTQTKPAQRLLMMTSIALNGGRMPAQSTGRACLRYLRKQESLLPYVVTALYYMRVI